MKKILHLQLLPLLSGVQRFSLHLLDGLDRNEFQIFVACKPGGEFVDAIKARGYNYLALPTFRHPISSSDLFTFVHLLWLLTKHRFDIVHTHSSKPGLLGRLAARLCRVPLILHTAHGTAFQDSQKPFSYRLFVLLETLGNRLGHRTIFVNNSDRLKCLELGVISDKKATTIYNALPESQAAALHLVAAERKVPSGQVVIGSTLRFSDQKNVINLVTASCLACKREQRLKFIFLGDGEHYELCKAILHTQGMEKRILLPGWDSEVLPWLKVFDAFVLYSRWEAMPFSIIEAMHSGLPVIASDIPSLAELIEAETGYLIPLNCETELADTFIQIAQNYAAALAKGQAAARKIRQLCSYAALIKGYREIYLADPD